MQIVIGVILLCKILTEIMLEKIANSKKANIPNKKLKNKHFCITFFMVPIEFWASSSETILTQARLIPESARVMPKAYVDINNWYKPTASFPILLEIYTPKDTPINCKKIDIIVKINPFIINSFNFLKKITYSFIFMNRCNLY